jgi:hypothetical protein
MERDEHCFIACLQCRGRWVRWSMLATAHCAKCGVRRPELEARTYGGNRRMPSGALCEDELMRALRDGR